MRRLIHDVIEWDVRTWSRALPLWEFHLPSQRPLGALALGERGGGLSLWLAMHGMDVLCTDMRPFPDSTVALHRRYGMQNRIAYGQEDVTGLSLGDAAFEVVAFKSVLGALGTRERQQRAFGEIHRVLRPGGVLLYAENLRGPRLHEWLRSRFVSWAPRWRYLDVRADRDLFQVFAQLDDRTTGWLSLFGRRGYQRDLLARLDRLLLPLIPQTWRTVWYGVARKAGALCADPASLRETVSPADLER